MRRGSGPKEQERVQKKVFTNWTNHYLAQIEEKTKLLTEQMAYLQTCASSTSSIDSIGQAQSPMPSYVDSPQRLTSAAPAAAIKPTAIDRWKGGARKALLHWVKNSISQAQLINGSKAQEKHYRGCRAVSKGTRVGLLLLQPIKAKFRRSVLTDTSVVRPTLILVISRSVACLSTLIILLVSVIKWTQLAPALSTGGDYS
ncbi:nesprin-1 [Trichonephila clavipes]|nr:nesprin-1 [Trichonephila clavipes]